MTATTLTKRELLTIRRSVWKVLTPEEKQHEKQRVCSTPRNLSPKPIMAKAKFAHMHTSQCEPFKAATIYAVTQDDRYIVYSYGEHYPMFIREGDQWYQNEDRYSPTTTRHHGYAHPRDPLTGQPVQTMPMSTGAMKRIALEGIAGLAAKGEVS